MESQLQNLIDKIKTDGILEADNKAKIILDEANKKCNQIILDATNKANDIIERAKKEAINSEALGKKALEQAARDVVLSIKNQIISVLENITKKETAKILNTENIKSMILKIAEKWNLSNSQNISLEVVLGKEDAKKLSSILIEELRSVIKSGIKIKPVDNIDAGFEIGETTTGVYFNFTADGMAEIISEYVNPKLAEIIKNTKDNK